MNLSQSLGSAFGSRGFSLERMQTTVYRINNSDSLTKRVAAQIISSIKYSPIISENRINGNIEFTVVPYIMDGKFIKVACLSKEISPAELWHSIESTSSLLEEEKPVIMQGKHLFNNPLEGSRQMALHCSKIASFLVDFFDQIPPGKALDLGCGPGVNSQFLLENGWNIVAIDQFPEVLEKFRSTINKTTQSFSETNSLQLIEADITSYELPHQLFDAVICIDALPYINSKSLKSLIQKIHDTLIPGGCFLGTFFISNQENKLVEEFMGKLGAHFYVDEHIVPSLLEYSGFHADCATQKSAEGNIYVEFIARKLVL